MIEGHLYQTENCKQEQQLQLAAIRKYLLRLHDRQFRQRRTRSFFQWSRLNSTISRVRRQMYQLEKALK